MPEKCHGFRITSIIIAVVMIVGCFGFFIGRFTPSVSASVTGDGYVPPFIDASGNWLVQNVTTYDGTDVAVTGNIYVNGTTLTFRNCKVTMSEAYQYEHNIESNLGSSIYFIKANVTTNPEGTNYPLIKIGYTQSDGYGGHVYFSNSTLSWVYWVNVGSHNYMDNCTVWASQILDYGATGFHSLNITSNHFSTFNGTNLIQASAEYFRMSYNHFQNMSPTWDAGNPGLVYYYGGSGNDGKFANIRYNNFDYNSSMCFLGLTNVYLCNVSHNTFKTVTSKAAIYVTGQGGWTSIDNNTFQNIEVGNNTQAAGIEATSSTTYNWLIAYNHFWNIWKMHGYTNQHAGYAISWGGHNVEIKHNHIGNITGDVSLATEMMFGIGISGEGNSVNAFANISYNTIDSAVNNVNCIVFENRDYGRIDNNTLHTVSVWSRGFGVYWTASNLRCGRYVDILDNVITDLRGDSSGIIVTHNATDDRVLRNRITVSALGQPGEYEEGAIVVNGESWIPTAGFQGASYTGDNCLIANNTIVNNNAKLPDYQFSDCWKTTWGVNLRLIINQNANIQYSNATFTLVVYGYVSITDSNTSQILIETDHHGYSVFNINRTAMGGGDNGIDGMDNGWLNVTSNFGFYNPTESTLLGLVVMFVVVGILLIPVVFIVKTAKEKKKPEIKDFIEIAIIVVIGLGFVGVMWSMLG